MRCWLLSVTAAAVLAACSIQPPARPSPPPVSALGKPVKTYSLAFSASVIEGCSQTLLASSYEGGLTLAILAGSRAALIYEGESFEVDTRRSDDRTTRYRTRDYAVWAGDARWDGEALLLELWPKGSRCEALPLYGDGPGVKTSCLGFYMKEGDSIELRCVPGLVLVTRRRDRAPDAPRESVEEQRPAFRCRPASRLPYPVDLFVQGGDLSFPLDPGIRFRYIDDLGLGGAQFELNE
jgi:hypothetical protein